MFAMPGPPSLANTASFAVDVGSVWGNTANARSSCRPFGRLRSIGTLIDPHNQDGSSAHGANATFGRADSIDTAAVR